MKTVQLRRYAIIPEHFDAFLAWWQGPLTAARLAHGFTIEFGYAIPASHEFVWAVSLSGDAAHFAEVEAVYIASPERNAAFADQPAWTTSQTVNIVSAVA